MTSEHIVSIDPRSRIRFLAEMARQPGAEVVASLDETSLLCRLPEGFSPHFALHRFPVHTVTELSSTERDEVFSVPAFANAADVEGRYSFQLSANKRLPWSLAEIIPAWSKSWGLDEKRWDSRHPESIFSGHFQIRDDGGCTLYGGTSTPLYNLSSWSRGRCRIPRDHHSISRAEQKLQEALEILSAHGFDLQKGEGRSALDLGAAPGGWTRILVECGYTVWAVDPAELHLSLLQNESVQHHRTTAGEFLRRNRHKFDLLVSDMKMDATRAARLAYKYRNRLTESAVGIVTLKLPSGATALENLDEALAILKKGYRIIQARQLYFNRNEVTVLLSK